MENLDLEILLEGRNLVKERPELKQDIFWKHWLMESQGIPSQLDEMIEAILMDSILTDIFNNYNGTEPRRAAIQISGKVKDVPGNFIGENSFLKFIVTPEDRETGYVKSGKLKYNEETGLLDNVEIFVQLSAPYRLRPEILKAKLRSTLSHELVHVYEDYCRQKGGKDSLATSLQQRNYRSVEDPTNQFEWFQYLLDPAEQRAFIAETVDDVCQLIRTARKLGRLDKLSGIRDISNLLNKTEFGPTYKELWWWVEMTQWDRMPSYQQKILVDKFEKATGYGVRYDRMVKIIRNRFRDFDKRLRTKISQAVVRELSPEEREDIQENLQVPLIYSAF